MSKTLTIFILSIVFVCINKGQAQVESDISPNFKQYLVERGLWQQWLDNRAHFSCPNASNKNNKLPLNPNPNEQKLPSSTNSSGGRNTGKSEEEEISQASLSGSNSNVYTLKFSRKDSLIIADCLNNNKPFPYIEDVSAEALAWGLQQRAKLYIKKQKKDTSFFRQNGFNVLTFLQRFPAENRYRSKIIVIDITASMSPYAEQVLVWQQMNIEKEEVIDFLFFNDGDRKPDEWKTVSATGGIYPATGRGDSVLTIVSQMQKSIKAGQGGDRPENYVEALLAAQRWWEVKNEDLPEGKKQELFLIADAKSSMRDLLLVKRLKVPVHVVLCGVKDYVEGEVALDFLLVPYLTGGSLHTINGDIWDVAPLVEGKIIPMDGKRYLIQNKKLVRLTHDGNIDVEWD